MSIDRKRAFTLIELIVIIVVLVVSLAVLFSQLRRAGHTAKRSVCVDNLKQILLAELLYLNDHEFGTWPTQVSTNAGGTLEYVQSGALFQHFMRFTNEFAETRSNTNQPPNPKVLVCPSDERKAAKSFATLGNSNLSYFVNADMGRLTGAGPQPISRAQDIIVLGDRNITNGTGLSTLSITVSNTNRLGWNNRMHNKGKNASQPFVGNVATIDGSVHTTTSVTLKEMFGLQVLNIWPIIETNRLILP